MCICTELLGINLYELIKLNKFKGLPIPLVRHFTKQILEGLKFLESKEIIHCDLKPENILIEDPIRGKIKIIDFGSSCFESEKVYTYIQSRFYRSPEVILGMVYNRKIDIWSLGCIVAELITGQPLFIGENEQEQIACIMEVMGVPEISMINKCSRRKLFFDYSGNPRIHVSSKNIKRHPNTKSLKKELRTKDDVLIDFVTATLIWNPKNRLSPIQGLYHEFITGVSNTVPSPSTTSTANLSTVASASTISVGTMELGLQTGSIPSEASGNPSSSSRNSTHTSISSARQSIASLSGLPVIEPNADFSPSELPKRQAGASHIVTSNSIGHYQSHRSGLNSHLPQLGLGSNTTVSVGRKTSLVGLKNLSQPSSKSTSPSHGFDLSSSAVMSKSFCSTKSASQNNGLQMLSTQLHTSSTNVSSEASQPGTSSNGPLRPLPSLPPARNNRRESAPMPSLASLEAQGNHKTATIDDSVHTATSVSKKKSDIGIVKRLRPRYSTGTALNSLATTHGHGSRPPLPLHLTADVDDLDEEHNIASLGGGYSDKPRQKYTIPKPPPHRNVSQKSSVKSLNSTESVSVSRKKSTTFAGTSDSLTDKKGKVQLSSTLSKSPNPLQHPSGPRPLSQKTSTSFRRTSPGDFKRIVPTSSSYRSSNLHSQPTHSRSNTAGPSLYQESIDSVLNQQPEEASRRFSSIAKHSVYGSYEGKNSLVHGNDSDDYKPSHSIMSSVSLSSISPATSKTIGDFSTQKESHFNESNSHYDKDLGSKTSQLTSQASRLSRTTSTLNPKTKFIMRSSSIGSLTERNRHRLNAIDNRISTNRTNIPSKTALHSTANTSSASPTGTRLPQKSYLPSKSGARATLGVSIKATSTSNLLSSGSGLSIAAQQQHLVQQQKQLQKQQLQRMQSRQQLSSQNTTQSNMYLSNVSKSEAYAERQMNIYTHNRANSVDSVDLYADNILDTNGSFKDISNPMATKIISATGLKTVGGINHDHHTHTRRVVSNRISSSQLKDGSASTNTKFRSRPSTTAIPEGNSRVSSLSYSQRNNVLNVSSKPRIDRVLKFSSTSSFDGLDSHDERDEPEETNYAEYQRPHSSSSRSSFSSGRLSPASITSATYEDDVTSGSCDAKSSAPIPIPGNRRNQNLQGIGKTSFSLPSTSTLLNKSMQSRNKTSALPRWK